MNRVLVNTKRRTSRNALSVKRHRCLFRCICICISTVASLLADELSCHGNDIAFGHDASDSAFRSSFAYNTTHGKANNASFHHLTKNRSNSRPVQKALMLYKASTSHCWPEDQRYVHLRANNSLSCSSERLRAPYINQKQAFSKRA